MESSCPAGIGHLANRLSRRERDKMPASHSGPLSSPSSFYSLYSIETENKATLQHLNHAVADIPSRSVDLLFSIVYCCCLSTDERFHDVSLANCTATCQCQVLPQQLRDSRHKYKRMLSLSRSRPPLIHPGST